MGDVANRRKFLEAAHVLAKTNAPTNEDIKEMCEAFSALLTDMVGERIVVVPIPVADFAARR